MKNEGGPVYPRVGTGESGMTLRDMFAAQAPDYPLKAPTNETETEAAARLATWAWAYADAVLQCRRSS